MLNLHLPRAVGAWLHQLTGQSDTPHLDAHDTVAQWPPTPARVLVSTERHAHKALAQALAREHAKGFVLAHVPLSKLVKVPRQKSYREWLSRTGLLTVDFALCDEHGYARSAVLMPLPDEPQPRQLRKRERLLRVLTAAGITVVDWQRDWQGADAEQLRGHLFPKPRGEGYYADTPQAPH